MRTCWTGAQPVTHFSVSDRFSPRPSTGATGGIGLSGCSENHPESELRVLCSPRAVQCDTPAFLSRQSSQRGMLGTTWSCDAPLALAERVLTIGRPLQPAGFPRASFRAAQLRKPHRPCRPLSSVCSTKSSRRSPPLTSERHTAYEKRNADQRLAAGRMPHCDC